MADDDDDDIDSKIVNNVTRRRRLRHRTASIAIPMIAVAAGIGCSQIIGADKKRRVVEEAAGTSSDASLDAGATGNTGDADADPGLPSCGPGEKRCSGACVDINDPTFGCTATSCERCSLPYADSVKCAGGGCAVATCTPDGAGRADCNGKGVDGCEGDLGSYKTCGTCTVACGGQKPFCNSGTCVDTCPSPKALCADADAGVDAGDAGSVGDCIDTSTNAAHCGGCNHKCPDANNATGICVGSVCALKCNNGFAECDEPPNLANGCEPLIPYYVDADGDGFGVLPQAGQACKAPPGNSLIAGDCLDTTAAGPNVKPGQTAYFATGYTKAGGGISYDYNCNLSEDSEPGKPIGDCGGLGDGCLIGYTPAGSRPGAQNVYCGTTNFVTCASACVSGSASSYRCR